LIGVFGEAAGVMTSLGAPAHAAHVAAEVREP